jgi:phospholipase/carboxylesterase
LRLFAHALSLGNKETDPDPMTRRDHQSDNPPNHNFFPQRVSVETVGYYYTDPAKVVSPVPAVVGIHGYGQTAQDFLHSIRRIIPDRFLAVAPQGSNQLWDWKSGKITFSWMTSFEKEDNIKRNNRLLYSIVDRLAQEGKADSEGVFLFGFSQGSSVALRFALHYPERVRGLVSVCSDLPPDVEERLDVLSEIPMLIVHAVNDRFVSPKKTQRGIQALQSSGVDVRVLSFEGEHQVPCFLAPSIQEWLERIQFNR